MLRQQYCGSAHCKEKHEPHPSGLFLCARNCGASRHRTAEELKAADATLLKYNQQPTQGNQ
jgi:hypothetical protein